MPSQTTVTRRTTLAAQMGALPIAPVVYLALPHFSGKGPVTAPEHAVAVQT